MIISHILGGIGNQMFQYAAGRALSLYIHQDLLLDIGDFSDYRLHQGFELTKVFSINTKIADNSDIKQLLGWKAGRLARRLLRRQVFSRFRGIQFVNEPYFHYWPEFFNLSGDTYLSGYWQSEQYFKQFADTLRQDFIFKESLFGLNAELSVKIANSQSISLHVRRGDYVSDAKSGKVMNICDLEYYRAAIDWIIGRVSNPVFYIFSDDMNWVREHLTLPFPCHYIDHNCGADSYRDMQLMSLCQHNIIANSSFSWWGAWLNTHPEKLVIAPKTWFIDKQISDTDLLPKNWIRL